MENSVRQQGWRPRSPDHTRTDRAGRTNVAVAASVQCSHGLPALWGRHVLEFRGGLRAVRRPVSHRPARPDHRRRPAAVDVEHPAGRPERRTADRRRSRLGRPGHDRRHAAAIFRRHRGHRSVPRARQAGGRRRPGRHLRSGALPQREFPGARRSRGHHRQVHRGVGGGRARRRRSKRKNSRST